MALLNLTGVVLFIAGGAGGYNGYSTAPHQHYGDNLRIPIPTSHQSGTVYILPSRGYGFDAVWTPKITNEYEEVDKAMKNMQELLAKRNGSYGVPTTDLRNIFEPFLQQTIITPRQLEDPANWLYLTSDKTGTEMRKMRCRLAPGVHLIGNAVAFALCHAEYMIFMNQDKLNEELQGMLFMLRNPKRSGIVNKEGGPETIGSQRGDRRLSSSREARLCFVRDHQNSL